MPKIVKLKTTRFSSRDNIKNSIISKSMEEIKKKTGHDLYAILPNDKYEIVEFEIENTNSAFANAIRRTLISEMPVWSLNLKINSMESNDPYVRFDDFADRVMTLPIAQTLLNNLFNKGKDPNKLFKFKIFVENNQTDIMHVLSQNIEIISNKDFKVDSKITMFNDSVSLQILRPGYFIKCQLILERGYGFQHGGKFSATKNPIYYPVDIRPMKREYKKAPTGLSSLVVNPKKFFMSYETYGTYDNQYEPMILTLMEIQKRITSISDEIVNYVTLLSDKKYVAEHSKLGEIIYFYKSSIIIISKEADTFIFRIDNESLTVSKLFSRYIYELNPNINYVSDLTEHPSKRSVKVKVNHDDALRLMVTAGKKIISDIDLIMNTFK